MTWHYKSNSCQWIVYTRRIQNYRYVDTLSLILYTVRHCIDNSENTTFLQTSVKWVEDYIATEQQAWHDVVVTLDASLTPSEIDRSLLHQQVTQLTAGLCYPAVLTCYWLQLGSNRHTTQDHKWIPCPTFQLWLVTDCDIRDNCCLMAVLYLVHTYIA